MIAGFLALAVATVSTGVTLWVRLRTGIAGRIGAAMVVLAGVGMVVAALARQDCSDARAACAAAESAGTVSGHHVIHQLGSLVVFLVLTIALWVLARGLRTSRAWAHLAVPTRLAGLAAFAGIAMLVTVGFGAVEGLVERAVVTLFVRPADRARRAVRSPLTRPAGSRPALRDGVAVPRVGSQCRGRPACLRGPAAPGSALSPPRLLRPDSARLGRAPDRLAAAPAGPSSVAVRLSRLWSTP